MKSGNWKIMPRVSALALATMFAPYMMTGMALLFSGHALAQYRSVGAVYTATNETAGNSVLIFSRSADGALTSAGSISTRGQGVGVVLQSQGSVMLSPDGRWLLVVNAGSNDVTVFSVSNSGLEFRSRTPSGGMTPVSITILGDVVYVVNQGSFFLPVAPSTPLAPNVVGFRLGWQGTLTQISGSIRTLSAGVAPAEVAFTPEGRLLVVTDIIANLIFTLEVHNDVAGDPVSHTSVGLNPFGFAFDGPNHILVSEGNLFGSPSSVSSYDVTAGGALDVVTASATTNQVAACWVVVTGNGRFAYVTDTGSSVVTGFAVGRDGRLSILNRTGVSASVLGDNAPGSGPAVLDIGLTNNSQFLYSLAAFSSDSITGWRTDQGNGSLTLAGSVGGLPPSSAGIAVR